MPSPLAAPFALPSMVPGIGATAGGFDDDDDGRASKPRSNGAQSRSGRGNECSFSGWSSRAATVGTGAATGGLGGSTAADDDHFSSTMPGADEDTMCESAGNMNLPLGASGEAFGFGVVPDGPGGLSDGDVDDGPGGAGAADSLGDPLADTLMIPTHGAPPVFTQVTPSLFIGRRQCASNEAAVREAGITGFVCVATEVADPFPEYVVTSGGGSKDEFATYHARMVDDATTSLATSVPPVLKEIDAMIAAGRRVAVYCQQGKSRSAAVVMMHLMRDRRCTAEDALLALRAVYPRADPNVAFLVEMGEISVAGRDDLENEQN